MRTADNYIQSVTTLPPAPRILVQLLGLLGQDDVSPSRVVDLITYDPALTAKILQRCNSAAGGLAEPVCELDEAVARVGFNEVYRLVAAVVGESTLGAAQPGYGIGRGELWEHSVVTAMAAKVLTAGLGADENVAFTAGLLHDLGKLVLSTCLDGKDADVVRQAIDSGRSFLEGEKIVLGVEHAEVGGRLLECWNFPPNLVQAVRCHHDPLQARPYEQLAACVYLGDLISHFLGYGFGRQAYAVRGRSEALQTLGLTSTDLEKCVLQTDVALKGWMIRA